MSAWLWAKNPRVQHGLRYMTLIRRAVRVPDPCLEVHADWLIRRLAPDCSRVERTRACRAGTMESRLLWMMGWETGNMHLGTPGERRAILADLGKRKSARSR